MKEEDKPMASITTSNSVAFDMKKHTAPSHFCSTSTINKYTEKPSNPKDKFGVRKWRQITCVPFTVLWELGAAMMEGARKYGRHNYRVIGVRASVYVDAAMGHIMQWWEGEDVDPESGISHLTKAIASLVVLRDAMIQNQFNDDRPPGIGVNTVRDDLQKTVDSLWIRIPEECTPFIREQSVPWK